MYGDFFDKRGETMKVFISWSGEVSFQVAKVLKEWIPCVIQDVEPYFSSEDIDKGVRWSTDIAMELERASFGILCVTKDNLESQWLNFEAGALSKAIDKSKVCPLLFRLKPSDISNSPILQFQMTNIERDDMFKLFKSINSSLDDMGLDENILEKVFSTFWPKIEKAFSEIKDIEAKKQAKGDEQNNNSKILEEMLELLRMQQMLLKSPERLLPQEYFKSIMGISAEDNVRYINSLVSPKDRLMLFRYEEKVKELLSEEYSKFDEEMFQKLKMYVNECSESYKKILDKVGFKLQRYRVYMDK